MALTNDSSNVDNSETAIRVIQEPAAGVTATPSPSRNYGFQSNPPRTASARNHAQNRRLQKRMSKATSGTIFRQGSQSVRERWTKKLEDFRTYDVRMLKSLLPLKAGVGTALAGSLAFAPFVPEQLTYYGVAAVVGVDWSLENNVGLTLQKGWNILLGSSLAGLCSVGVRLIQPHTGRFEVYYLIVCVFLGGFVPRCIALPKITATRWSQTTFYYVNIFHALILSQALGIDFTTHFLLSALCYTIGFFTVLFLTLCVKPEYAGDALLVLLVSDFHTAGVVLERIVDDYKGGVMLTKIQDLLSGVVTEDHIYHDLQYIIKSTAEVEKLMNAALWEPSHGKFFKTYPWDLYSTLVDLFLHVLHDLITLDSALRAEIQAPLEIRLFFSKQMETVSRECSMLFHKLGDALLEHKKIDYQSNVRRAQLATLNLRLKLNKHAATLISQDDPLPSSSGIRRRTSWESIEEDGEELPEPMSPTPTPPPSPTHPNRENVLKQDRETAQKLNLEEEDDWRVRLFTRRRSVFEHLEETQQQISSLSFIKFATILIELMGKVKSVVTMVDRISEKAQFRDVS